MSNGGGRCRILFALAVVLVLASVAEAATVSPPTSLSATALSTTEISLSWGDPNTSEDGTYIERSLSATSGFVVIATVGQNVTSYRNTGLTAGRIYYYRVQAFDRHRRSSYSNTASAMTPSSTGGPPTAPTTLAAGPTSSSQINLSWTDNSTNESGFRIERATTSGAWSEIATTVANVTSYSNTGLSASITYYYRVRAYNTAGSSSYSNTASATTPSSSSGTLPIAPSTLTATAASCSQINLNWTDNSFNESGFRVERATSAAGPWSQIGTVGANAISYPSTSLSASTSYYHRVRAYNSAGASSYSNTASRSTPACPVASSSQWSMQFGGAGAGDIAVGRATAIGPGGDVFLAASQIGIVDYGSGPLTGNSAMGLPVLAKYSAAGVPLWARLFLAPSTNGGTALPTGVAPDIDGSVVMVGYFQNTVNFGGGPLTSAGSPDVFVAKYSATGNHLWSHRFGGTGSDKALGVAVDGTGAIYVTGLFAGSVDFGGGTASMLTSTGSADAFLAKYDPQGRHLWSRRFGGSGSDGATGVAVDPLRSVVITGYFEGSATFGGRSLASAGGRDIFVASLSPDGSVAWANGYGGSGTDEGRGIGIDGNGNVVIAALFEGSVSFGGPSRASAGMTDIVLAKYSTTGTHQWSQRFGGIWGDVVSGLAVNPGGAIAITGGFVSGINFGSGPLPENGSWNAFVATFSATGAPDWSIGAGRLYDDHGNGVAISGTGEVVATGDFYQSVNFGDGDLVNTGGSDGFLIRVAP